jgi:hypothetical protein
MYRALRVALIGAALGCASGGGSASSTPGGSAHDELVSGDLGTARLKHDASTTVADLAATRDQVWEVLIEVNEELALPLVGANRKTGEAAYFLQSYNHRLAGKPVSAYIDCGSGPMGNNADLQRVNVRVNESVASASTPDHTIVRVSLTASSRPTSNSSDELACSTYGLLEKRIVELIDARLEH